MNIRIDDDVPLPQPDKADTWQTGKPAASDGWVTSERGNAAKMMPSMLKPAVVVSSARYPAETTYDAKGVPTVDCFLVGGPLNGKHGPIVGTAKVVELDIYAADGTVSSVELYELGDKGELGVRHWKGTKAS